MLSEPSRANTSAPGTVSYELWRQDDNGIRFLIGCYETRSAAEACLAGLTRVLHKQVYWITEKADNALPFRAGEG